MEEGGAGPPAPASKPYLKRGSGWSARVAAAREGRRYVPKGGPVKDYSKEGEVPLPTGRRRLQPSRIPASPSKQPSAGSRAATGGPGYAARRPGARPASVAAAAPNHHRQQAPAARRAAPQQQAPAARPAASVQQQPAALPAEAASNPWAVKLLQARSPPRKPVAGGAQPVHTGQHAWTAKQSQEEVALEEFEALESQVLQEVGNRSPGQHPPGPGSSPARKAPFSTGSRISQGQHGGMQPHEASAGCWPSATADLKAAGTAQAAEMDGEVEEVEDVFESDGEGNVRHMFGGSEGGLAEAAAAGISHPLARRAISFAGGAAPASHPVPAQGRNAAGSWLPPVFREDGGEGEEAEMLAESSFVQELAAQPTSSLVQKFFSRPAPSAPTAALPAAAISSHLLPVHQLPPQHLHSQLPAPSGEAEAVEQLQQEVVRLQEERARVARMRLELEEATARLEQEKAAFDKKKMEEAARFEAERGEELRKLQRDRRVLEKQSRAILKMPTKQSKEEVQAVEALLAEERRSARAREARHKLTVERLRQQIVELQGKNGELREQVQYLEQQRLQHSWGAAQPAVAAAAGGTAAGGEVAPTAGRPARSVGPGTGVHSSQEAPVRRHRQPGGLPAVRVERGGGASCASGASAAPVGVGRSAANAGERSEAGQQPVMSSVGQTSHQLDSEEEGEQCIADVQLSVEEEVVVCGQELDYGVQQAQDQQQQQPYGQDGQDRGHAAERSQLSSRPDSSRATGGWHAASPKEPAARAQYVWQQNAQPQVQAGPAGALFQQGAADAVSKASAALERFNHLHDSLAQHEGLQARLAGRLGSQQPQGPEQQAPASPSGRLHAPLAPPSSSRGKPAAEPAGQDDLRRLGRSLLASGGLGEAACSAEAALLQHPVLPAQAQAPQQQVHLQPQAPSATAAAGEEAGEDAVVTEVQHPDGRWERLFASGLREQRFSNGSIKQQLPGGASLTRFANGDVKKALPCGTVEYYYAEVSSWQVTHPSGVEVFFFPSGQVEAHHPGGVKEILFADGAVRKVLPDGRELVISAAHLSPEIQAPQPVPRLV